MFYYFIFLYLIALPTVVFLIMQFILPEKRTIYRRKFLAIWISSPLIYLVLINIDKMIVFIDRFIDT